MNVRYQGALRPTSIPHGNTMSHYFESVTLRSIGIAFQIGVPVLLEAEPGCGKSEILESIMAVFADDSHTAIASLYDPTYFGGYPVPVKDEAGNDVVAMIPNAWTRRLADAEKQTHGRVGFFADELTSSAPATRAAAQRGLLTGTWGDTHVAGMSVVAAQNPADIAESGIQNSAPIANRFCHILWDMPVDWWDEQQIADFPPPRGFVPVPADWKQSAHFQRAKVILSGFTKAFRSDIQSCPETAEARSKAWPSFRSWTMARNLVAAALAAGEQLTPDHCSDVIRVLVAGCVGQAVAAKFCAFAMEMDLPDPEKLLDGSVKLSLPERGDKAHACLSSVVAAVVSNNTPERWGKAWDLMAQAVEGDNGRVDIAAGQARVLARNKPQGVNRPPKAIKTFIPILKAAGLMS